MKQKRDIHLGIRISKEFREKLEKKREQVIKDNGFPVTLSSFILAVLENYLDEKK